MVNQIHKSLSHARLQLQQRSDLFQRRLVGQKQFDALIVPDVLAHTSGSVISMTGDIGFVHTRLTDEKESGDIVAGEALGIPKKVRDNMLEGIGGKTMTPEEAARPVLFLASSDSDFITGHTLNVSAGMYI